MQTDIPRLFSSMCTIGIRVEMKTEKTHLQFDVFHLLAFMFHVLVYVCVCVYHLMMAPEIEHSEQFKVDEKMCKYKIIFIEDIRSAECNVNNVHCIIRAVVFDIGFSVCVYIVFIVNIGSEMKR